MINLVRSKYETLWPSFGKSKGSSNRSRPSEKGSDYCGKGGKAHGRRERSGKGNESNGNPSSNGGSGKVKVSMKRCFRCKATATIVTVAPQNSAKDVVGDDTRAASAHRRRI